VQAKRKMEVTVPPGVNDGDTMQIRGEGNFDKKRLAAWH
jgi:molecular chaperone DnaJ